MGLTTMGRRPADGVGEQPWMTAKGTGTVMTSSHMTSWHRHRHLHRPLHRVLPARSLLLLAMLVVILAALAVAARI
jgi:hypothetical protein